MPRYLDIDEILSEDERITCRMLQDTAFLGHLNSNIDSPDLPRDAKVEVPMWLAEVFFEVSSCCQTHCFILPIMIGIQ